MYYRKGQLGLFQRLLLVLLEGMTQEEGVRTHIYGGEDRKFFDDLIRVYNKLASERAMAALAARRARDAKGRMRLFDEAKRFFNDAARVTGKEYDDWAEETMARQGWAVLTAGDNWEGAAYWLNGALEVRGGPFCRLFGWRLVGVWID